jgi:hypothetical protein
MLSFLRRRLCYANVVATLALVFAMSGGALAAGHYLLTSTNQVSPKVLKALKGKEGKNGPAGALGAQGPQGAQGPTGEAGAAGPAGAQGAEGVQGPKGETGTAGKEGSPWTAGGTLPSGKSETGVWGGGAGPEETGFSTRVVLASFAIPLLTPPTVYAIGVEEGQGEAHENERIKLMNEKRKMNGEPELPLPIPTDCKGTVAKPEATAGDLCVFVRSSHNVYVPDLALPSYSLFTSTAGVVSNIVSPTGDYEEEFSIEGSWAVTAK